MNWFNVRRHWLLVAIVVLGAAAPCAWADVSYSSVVLTDTPVGYWRLGESSSAPAAADSSGSPTGHGGIYSRGVTSGATGAIHGDTDTAATFDGMTSFVDVEGGQPNPYNLTVSFTLEAWVINNGPIESPTAGRIISTRVLPPATSGGYGLGVLTSSNNVRFTTYGVKDYDSGLTNIPVDGNWHHIVLVFDSTFTANFYLDGQLTESIPSSGPANASPSDLNIGRNPVPDGGPFYEYWNGSIDEVAVYNYELGADRISAHFQSAQ